METDDPDLVLTTNVDPNGIFGIFSVSHKELNNIYQIYIKTHSWV